MTFELGMTLAATLCGILGIVLAWSSRADSRKCRELLEFTAKQVEDLELTLAENCSQREAGDLKIKDQSRRIAWLETRIRQPKAVEKAAVPEEIMTAEPTDILKSNITERRHRILTLASRGQNVETIASTLGMMPGEVQLVMNLNRRQTSFV